MRKRILLVALVVAVLTAMLVAPSLVAGQVVVGTLKDCAQLAFSTEEDFVSGDLTISDGDLLGIVSDATGTNCYLCAQNLDLLQIFDEWYDLGLDAVDVVRIAEEQYLVAFSTELDSIHGNFTAGDLLVTNGGIIPNETLTDKFGDQGIGYDLGLDAVHLVGDPAEITGFLRLLVPLHPTTPGELDEMFKEYPTVDILFSTEGTWSPVGAVGFLDGDLLSAAAGTIEAKNSELLDPSVPADVRDGGVDFGLDAATTARVGSREEWLREVHFSTEILFDNEVSFTDGDVLQFGDGVVATNWELIQCFAPKAEFLGLDALSTGVPEEPGCVSRITDIAGIDLADISPADGMAFPGTVSSIGGPVPFGGWIDISGTICDDVSRFRVLYRLSGSSNPWEPIPVLNTATTDWQVQTDAFFPPIKDCLKDRTWFSDGNGWYDAADYRHLTEASLGGCNPGLALTVWESAAVPSGLGGPEALHEVVLATDTASGIVSGTVQLVQLDNTAPTVELQKPVDTCEIFGPLDMALMVKGRIQDDHFHSYRLLLDGDSYPTKNYGVVAYYDADPAAASLIDTGTINWDVYQNLRTVDVFDLATAPMDCGYAVRLTAWDRTLRCTFDFPANAAYRCPGCRHSNDTWVFKYAP